MVKKPLILIYLFIASIGFSQRPIDYVKKAQEPDANYFDIVSKVRKEFQKKNSTSIADKKAKKQFERWAYFWENRVSADGRFPNENTGYFNAGILDEQGRIVNNATSKMTRNSTPWENVSPNQTQVNNNGYTNYPQMGRLNAFLRIKHPTDANQDVLFVGAPNGGIWKSTNNGQTWSAKLDFVAGIGVTDIETVPGTTTANYTTRPIYVSTGDYDGRQVRSIGVLKSNNGGESFQSTGLSYTLQQSQTLGDLVVIDANTVFVAAGNTIRKTVNGGTTWTTAYQNAGDNQIGRAVRNGNEIMFTGGSGVYYTSNYNTDSNWSRVVTMSDKSAVTTDNNGDFFIQNISGQVQKFNKTNSTFSNVGSAPTGYEPQYGYNQALIVTNDIMISGEFNGSSSSNNGTNWVKSLNGYWNPGNGNGVGTYIHSDHHRMGKRDGSLEFWSCNDGGLDYITYASASSSTPTIQYKSSHVLVNQAYTVAINPNANDGAYIMALQDNDAFSKRNGTWYAVALGDGIQGAINYNNADIRYAGQQSGYVVKTTTGFQGQLQGDGNYVQVTGASFYFPMEMHKTNPNIIYAGGNDVYKLDGSTGLTMSATSSGLSGVKSIATHANSVMASTNSDVKFSSDQGGSWTNVSLPSGASGTITSVDYSAANTNTRYLTYGGYSATNKVFKTTNGGTSWTNITGDLPNVVVNEVILRQGASSEVLYIATELGVYQTKNGGTNWTKLGQGLPHTNVTDLDIHYTAQRLVVSTFGRGIWQISIDETLSVSNEEKEDHAIAVYPNPTNNQFRISVGNTSSNYKYELYNAVGGVIKSGAVTTQAIDVSDLASNLYLVRIYNDTHSVTKKLMVK